jgi:hypothetical protein
MHWGIGFMNDPVYEFARECILRPTPELERMQNLHRDAIAFTRKTCGDEGELLQAALKRIEDLYDLEASAPPTFSYEMIVDKLIQVWPERAHAAGDKAILDLTERAHEIADQQACPGLLGTLATSLLLILLGYECNTDPQYKWFWKFKKSANQADNTSALISRSKAYLKEAQGL